MIDASVLFWHQTTTQPFRPPSRLRLDNASDLALALSGQPHLLPPEVMTATSGAAAPLLVFGTAAPGAVLGLTSLLVSVCFCWRQEEGVAV